ncbi:MAG: TRAP transporter large permease subunit [Dehalococcoidia bacterium]|nr:TRAP transporter large permease subunit [Dehalococcoidia bacterium]
MDWYWIAVIMFGGLFFLISARIPVYNAMATMALVGILFLLGPKTLPMLAQTTFSTMTNFVLIAIPLFIFMAEIVMVTDLHRDVFGILEAWLGRLPGGLGVSTIAGSATFAAITGSSAVNTAIMGLAATEEMRARGYDSKLAVGTVAAGGALGILIPPSIPMIVYGVVTEQSVGHLFMGGMVPGLLLMLFFMATIIIRCKINPKLAPSITGVSSLSVGKKILLTAKALPALSLIVVVLGVIYLGIATPTEAAGLGCIMGLVLNIGCGKFSLPVLHEVLLRTVKTTCFILSILMAAMIYSAVVAHLGVLNLFSDFMTSLPLSPIGIIAMIMALFLILGCFLDPTPIIVLTMPFLFPAVTKLGFDPIWFGVVATINMEMACITPPVGFNLFVMQGIVKDMSFGDIARGSAAFIPLQALLLVLVVAFPDIILWLPSRMIGH